MLFGVGFRAIQLYVSWIVIRFLFNDPRKNNSSWRRRVALTTQTHSKLLTWFEWICVMNISSNDIVGCMTLMQGMLNTDVRVMNYFQQCVASTIPIY